MCVGQYTVTPIYKCTERKRETERERRTPMDQALWSNKRYSKLLMTPLYGYNLSNLEELPWNKLHGQTKITHDTPIQL